jgi:hypothetical protein
MSALALFTLFHTLISIVAMVLGLALVWGLVNGQRLERLTLWTLGLLVATTLTGFLFPFHGFTPAIGTGIVSTVLLVLAIAARYRFQLAGRWRAIYVVSAVTVIYLDWFVFVVQAFLKIPPLHALAPKGNEPLLGAVQGIVLLSFVITGYFAVKRFRTGVALNGA